MDFVRWESSLPYPLDLNGQYEDERNTNLIKMKNAPPFYIIFQVKFWRYFLWKFVR